MQTLIFDLGNVILFFDHERMCRQVSALLKMPLEETKRLCYEMHSAYEAGEISTDALAKAFRIPDHIPMTAFTEALGDIFTPNTDLIHLIHRLKKAGVELVLLSNTNEAHYTFAKKNFPVLSFFDATILSYEVGARKPEKEIYEAAMQAATNDPSSCFYTDDIPEYIDAARRLGIDAELFRGVPALERELQKRGVAYR